MIRHSLGEGGYSLLFMKPSRRQGFGERVCKSGLTWVWFFEILIEMSEIKVPLNICKRPH